MIYFIILGKLLRIGISVVWEGDYDGMYKFFL